VPVQGLGLIADIKLMGDRGGCAAAARGTRRHSFLKHVAVNVNSGPQIAQRFRRSSDGPSTATGSRGDSADRDPPVLVMSDATRDGNRRLVRALLGGGGVDDFGTGHSSLSYLLGARLKQVVSLPTSRT
jgi:hypothetical protein